MIKTINKGVKQPPVKIPPKSIKPSVKTPPQSTQIINTSNALPQKKSVFLLWLLTTITLNVYAGIWYLKKIPELDNLKTQKKLSKKLVTAYLILTIIFAIYLIISRFVGEMSNNSIVEIIVFIFAIGFMALHLTLAFNTRTIINQAWQAKGVTRKVSWLFTFMFSLFYLQYEINRTIDNQENEKRIGPWICLVLTILIPLITITIVWIALGSFIGGLGTI